MLSSLAISIRGYRIGVSVRTGVSTVWGTSTIYGRLSALGFGIGSGVSSVGYHSRLAPLSDCNMVGSALFEGGGVRKMEGGFPAKRQ